MKKKHLILLSVAINYLCSCHTNFASVTSQQFSDTFNLSDIPSANTLSFDKGLVYYEAMDASRQDCFKCFSLLKNEVVWSKPINTMGINQGTITATGEYAVPTLSDSIYLINITGEARILTLDDRCKINPLTYKDIFIVQDRGVGLKGFYATTLRQKWVIKQHSDFTLSQPLLLDSSLVYVLDDKNIQSSDALSGKLNWAIPFSDSFALHDLYGSYQQLAFILTTTLTKEKYISALNFQKGKVLWRVKVDSSVDELNRSMVATQNTLFCRGYSAIFTYDISDGKALKKYPYNSKIATNLVVTGHHDVLFGLNDNNLMKIDVKGKDSTIVSIKTKLDQLYDFNGAIYVYSYPNLFVLSSM